VNADAAISAYFNLHPAQFSAVEEISLTRDRVGTRGSHLRVTARLLDAERTSALILEFDGVTELRIDVDWSIDGMAYFLISSIADLHYEGARFRVEEEEQGIRFQCWDFSMRVEDN